MKFLYSTALTLVASIALAGAEPEGQLRVSDRLVKRERVRQEAAD